MKRKISNWGKYPEEEVNLIYFDDKDELVAVNHSTDHIIARGNGRCYGDSSLGENVISTLKYDKILSFDEKEGVIECQAGIVFDDLLKVIVPRGWFLPVTPGTKFITLGGAVASDVHGKNHHKEGSFSEYILSMQILCSDDQLYECDRERNEDLFWATCGGMGLTGIITRVRFRLKPIETSYIQTLEIKAKNLDHILELFDEYSDYTYSVAWIDCLKSGKSLGRSILMLGEHATRDELKKSGDPLKVHKTGKLNIPFNFPGFVLNKLSVKAFNALYYAKNFRKETRKTVHYDPFFYPLDHIHNWNRMYGKKGFLQYQFVVPFGSKEGLKKIIEKIATKNLGSFLAVLKAFGDETGMMSFPRPGYTLALDFPLKKGLLEFLDELDKLVHDYGGRVYLTKDARMSLETYWKTYPQTKEFQETLKKYNSSNKYQSSQSQRLNITS